MWCGALCKAVKVVCASVALMARRAANTAMLHTALLLLLRRRLVLLLVTLQAPLL
jgi:hypothetical protein